MYLHFMAALVIALTLAICVAKPTAMSFAVLLGVILAVAGIYILMHRAIRKAKKILRDHGHSEEEINELFS